VKQHPDLAQVSGHVLSPDADEPVHAAGADLRVSSYLLELLIQKLIPACPIDRRMHLWKEKRDRRLEVVRQGFLPGAVELIRCCSC